MQGRWQVWIGPLNKGGPSELTVNSLTIKNVLVGEVWLCSGQSNMEWPLINTINGAETVAQAQSRDQVVQSRTSDFGYPLNDVRDTGHNARRCGQFFRGRILLWT